MRFVLILLLSLLPSSLLAANRLALVIGNDDYSDVPVLEKAGADARAVGEKLRGLGFDTVEAIDQDRRGMNRRISEFTSKLQPGDTAFVFYAGHGVEIDGENYLLPTDIVAPSSGESDFVKSESIALSDLLDRVRQTGARTAIAVIDACRDNPFETVQGRSIGGTRGLGRITAPQGTFVIFSAGAGQMALDRLHDGDEAQNSVFTRALLPRLSKPGLELRALVSDLRLEVRDLASTVQHRQVPAYYDELLGKFYFTPAAAAAPVADALPSAAPEASDDMRADLALARSVGTVTALDSFLERYEDRAEDYSYTVALQLRQSLAQTDTAPASRQAETVEVAAAPVVADQRNVMRDTQVALNALGCSAGGADGVAGPRTKRAFSAYLRDSGSNLGADDLGTAHALEELQGHSGTICKVAVAPKPAPTLKTTTLSMAGTWSYKATCALVVKVTGQIRYTKAGGNKYNGKLTDSLGQKANTVIFLNENQLSGTDYFPGITVTWRGRLAPDGNSFTANGSTGCAVYAWRVG
ncbi:caspase family protein [Ruegeria jejuensis]|uniref:caspase family protein n=1 Tax=Ruegeria jejuensis TaxID=3233338 RepID=UPI00355BC0F8